MPISGLSLVPVGALVLVLLVLFVACTSFGIFVVHAGPVLASDNVVGIVDIALVGHENNPHCFYGGGALFLLLAVALSFVARTSFGIVFVHAGLVPASGNVVGIVDIALVGHENNPQYFYGGGVLFLLLALVLSFVARTSFGIFVVHAGLVPASGNVVGIVDIALVGHENNPQCFYYGCILFLLLALVLSFVAHTSFGIVVHAGLVLASGTVVGTVDIALVDLENNPQCFYDGGVLFLLVVVVAALPIVAGIFSGIVVAVEGLASHIVAGSTAHIAVVGVVGFDLLFALCSFSDTLAALFDHLLLGNAAGIAGTSAFAFQGHDD
ncbi:hypothetical protein CMV_011171 [Castanea mollissima]|uniref:Uncharacterized protein n=1 Tax=Castanea mollissima TaxID=60419 RepID=A0A8J4W075_9ROSI|nr:hypothetical protein CMV_011171 [Castanea mollissima]